VVRKEFIYLQFRFLCELTALGCLAAHGDVAETSSLKKKWQAQEIMEALEKLNPDFYPSPVGKMMRQNEGIHFDVPVGKVITKEEMFAVYGRSGNILHRGSLKNLLKAKNPLQNSFPDEARIAQEFRNLLAGHRISLLDGEFQLICLFGLANDPVTAVMAKALREAV